jgi:hypothetical protein
MQWRSRTRLRLLFHIRRTLILWLIGMGKSSIPGYRSLYGSGILMNESLTYEPFGDCTNGSMICCRMSVLMMMMMMMMMMT